MKKLLISLLITLISRNFCSMIKKNSQEIESKINTTKREENKSLLDNHKKRTRNLSNVKRKKNKQIKKKNSTNKKNRSKNKIIKNKKLPNSVITDTPPSKIKQINATAPIPLTTPTPIAKNTDKTIPKISPEVSISKKPIINSITSSKPENNLKSSIEIEKKLPSPLDENKMHDKINEPEMTKIKNEFIRKINVAKNIIVKKLKAISSEGNNTNHYSKINFNNSLKILDEIQNLTEKNKFSNIITIINDHLNKIKKNKEETEKILENKEKITIDSFLSKMFNLLIEFIKEKKLEKAIIQNENSNNKDNQINNEKNDKKTHKENSEEAIKQAADIIRKIKNITILEESIHQNENSISKKKTLAIKIDESSEDFIKYDSYNLADYIEDQNKDTIIFKKLLQQLIKTILSSKYNNAEKSILLNLLKQAIDILKKTNMEEFQEINISNMIEEIQKII
jgi:hypothetical protein